eukprot:CAMPEP_0204910072 /NCGR_PEP_ID=MMETSP1397-20131031/8658_1 /ASSEMBLY_ACC=CAM_ASM_000891 /TAXON_ID=49980 /ORGANISM="Climacostomum Climacostomum virens, Strain Stock W-24" /LENGTH=221 /DNA_ID=CAMNT_0052080097 /DNA_START=20 /DNA_END=685 /DNA_ORIENTATION=-
MNQGDCKRGRWSLEEDELLRLAVKSIGEKCWRDIATKVPGRTPIQCLHRWNKVLKPGLVKGNWTCEEDQMLKNWVETQGPTKWAKCANMIVGRSGKQCRERWMNSLNPDVKKGDWSPEEDSLIFRLYNNLGPRWSDIAKNVPGRTENSVKNRFYSTVRRMQQGSEKLVPESTNHSVEDPLQQMIELLAQMQQLENILKATKQEIKELETSAQAPSMCSLLD